MKSQNKIWHKIPYKYLVPGFILLFMFLLSVFSSRGIGNIPGDSGTVDEIAHIPSGYTYLKDLDYRLNPEHPPLAKVLAGVPLVLNGDIKGPESDVSFKSINQWESGWSMIYRSGNNPATVFFLSRLPMMLLMIGLGLLLFKWAVELFGWKVGVIVLFLYALYPDVIAHGRLVTTDVAAAFGYVLAIYAFDKAVTKQTFQSILLAGLALGLAELLKFSGILLYPILFIFVIIRSSLDKEKKGFWCNFRLNLLTLIYISLISLALIWIAYIPFVWKTPADIEHKLIETNLTSDPRTLPLRQFLHFFESNPFFRAIGHYILGVFMVIGRVGGGNTTFILGHLSEKSISWYFPVAWLLKTPITIMLLFFFSIYQIIRGWPKQKEVKWLLSLLIIPWSVYWIFTLKGSLNIGIRHLLPTIPFVLLMIGYAIYPIVNAKWNWRKLAYKQIILVLLLAYLAVSTVSNFPNFIAYFNEMTPRDKRYTRLIDSSLDWGQDLLRLKQYVESEKISSIKVDYFGGSVPSYYMPEFVNWHASYGPTSGWLAVSATFYQSSKLIGQKESKWSYHWLDRYEPKAIIGGSILVFNISSKDIRKNPPKSPYPIKYLDSPGEKTTKKIGL